MLLKFLLGSEVVAVTAGLLPAVGGPGVEPGVALPADHLQYSTVQYRTVLYSTGQYSTVLPADHLVAVVLLGEDAEAGLDDATTQPQHQVEGGLLLDVVVGQGPAILQLLARKDEPLLVGGNALLVLDLGLHVLDGVGGLHLQSNSLAREGLYKNLHS